MVLKRFYLIALFLIFMIKLEVSFARYAKESDSTEKGKLVALDVICGKDHMTVRAEFSAPFYGMVFSKGTYGQEDCMHIKPNSKFSHATFKVYYNACGTKPDLKGKYYENTIVIQYGTDIIEALDEAKRLRCEWFEAYEKPATFRPAIPVADLDVVEMNFSGDDIDCWMEILEGKGPWGNEVSRIVPVGQPMTIRISISDSSDQFDMKVKSCYAHDNVRPPILLTDDNGCVLRPQLLTPFSKIRDPTGKATVISYATFFAFKFPDSMNVQIQCTVEVCRHGCSEACSQGSQLNKKTVDVSSEIASVFLEKSSTALEDDNKPDPSKNTSENVSKFEDIKNAASSYSLSHLPYPQAFQENKNQAENVNLEKLLVPNYQHLYKNSEIGHSAISRKSEEFSTESEIILNTGDIESIKELGEKKTQYKNSEPDLYIPLPQLTPLAQSSKNGLKENKIHQAAKFLKDLGVVSDVASFATSLVNGVENKNLAQILKDDKLKELARVSGIKLKEIEALTDPQALITGPIFSLENIDNKVKEKQFSEQQSINTVTLKPVESGSYSQSTSNKSQHSQSIFYDSHDFTLQPNSNLKQKELHIPVIKASNNHRPVPDNIVRNIYHKPSNPVVQVQNIPLKLGLPFINLPFNSFNFLSPHSKSNHHPNEFKSNQHFGHQTLESNIPASIPTAHKSFFNLGSLSSLAPHFLQSMLLKKERPSQLHQNLPFTFPHGPRSFRSKRKVKESPQISLKKGFKVITSIDLSFSPNMTTDVPEVLEGRREFIYGICMSTNEAIVALISIVFVTIITLSFSFYFIKKLNKLKVISSNY